MDATSLTTEEIIARRKERLEKLRAQDKAYPNDFKREHTISEARELGLGEKVALAGRMDLRRKAGKATFANITDGSENDGNDKSNDIQVYANQDAPDVLAQLNELDYGDIIGVTGTLFKTRKGELTVQLSSLQVLSKCLQPYSVKGAPTETRKRKRRYLALAVEPGLRDKYRARSSLLGWLRRYFDKENYLEVETPMLHQVQGGAAAKPFVTRHEALGQDLYLRIAPELYLKRLLVGGFDRVYEVNRCFRNEGMSEQHNPEFTMLEFYAAYENYEYMMNFTEEMLRLLTKHDWRKMAGSEHDFESGVLEVKGQQVDFNSKFDRLSLSDAIERHLGCERGKAHDAGYLSGLLGEAEGDKAAMAAAAGDVGKLQMVVFEKFVESTLVQPTFITGYPASVSPLARRRSCEPEEGKPELADRFELYVGGSEIANGFSELNDPDVQDEVFREQVRQGKAGDAEAMQYDEDYIKALRYGMPPAAGEGIGIDRLVMLLLGFSSIRDAILFPQQRPEAKSKD